MGWLFDQQLNSTRKDANGNMKDSLAAPWFFKAGACAPGRAPCPAHIPLSVCLQESPEFYTWCVSG